jgi:hypothetical protein
MPPTTTRAALLVLAAAQFACSTSTGIAGPSPGPGQGLVAACPAQAPAQGSACAQRALDCEYGTDWNPACNTVAQCWRGGPLDGTWQLQSPSKAAYCPTPTTLAAGCPAASMDGQTCNASGALCQYGTALCGCFDFTSSAQDASVSSHWVCTHPPAAGCPAMRPRVGSACAQEGLFCTYAVCNVGGAVYCTAGAWTLGIAPNFCSGGG